MTAKGVLVTSRDKIGKYISRSSAVFLDEVILLNGNHLTPLLQRGKWQNIFNTILPTVDQNTEACAFIDDNVEFEMLEEGDYDGLLPEAIERVGRRFAAAAVWKCPLLEKSLKMFLSDDDDDSVLSCLSLFLVLKIPGDDFSFAERIPRWMRTLEVPVRGSSVIVESTPCGMQVFMNSWSHGVVSRLCGERRCLFLTDSAVHSQSAGAPVYTSIRSGFDTIEKGSLLGMVLGKTDIFTYGIALLPVLSRIAPCLPLRVTPSQSRPVRRLVDETVGGIESENLRGSGVIVDARHGIVLTCSHVIQNETATVRMYLRNDVFTCDLIHRIEDWDLAVLKASPKTFLKHHIEISESPARTGEIVCVAGFPHILPFERADIRPFVSFGCVSKSLPHAIVCNCLVTDGNSGGAVIRDEKLIGLVSFVQIGQSGFGFALPATLFRDGIRRYIDTGDVTHLKNLKSNDTVKQFWNADRSKL